MVKFKQPTSMTIPGRRQGKYSNNLFKYQVDEGIRVNEVNPAYTSQIGKIKYARQRGLSIHQTATMVIARKATGKIESILSELQCFGSTWKEVKQVFKYSKHNEHPLLALI